MPATKKAAQDGAIAALVGGTHRDPFAVLGPHQAGARAIVVRAFQPAAHAVELRIVATGELVAMEKVDAAGVFEVRLKAEITEASGPVVSGFSRTDIPNYRLRITFAGDHAIEIDDPYRYGRVLTNDDLHLFTEGTQYRAFDKLGAHRITVGTTAGVHFAVNRCRSSLVSTRP